MFSAPPTFLVEHETVDIRNLRYTAGDSSFSPANGPDRASPCHVAGLECRAIIEACRAAGNKRLAKENRSQSPCA